MIAIAPTSSRVNVCRQTADDFETMLPAIRTIANFAFRRLPHDTREDFVAEVVARSYAAFRRLVDRGLADLAYPTPLGWFAVRQVRDGRRLGSKLNARDVLSGYAQKRKGFSVQSLHHRRASGRWEELAVENRKTGPADVATFRVDFGDWLARLKRFKRQVALRLIAGDTTTEAARHFKLTLARISQLRQELRANWDQFQASPVAA